jgi:hypothetical protein
MNPDIPILMITLQIPVTPDTTADEVLEAIGQQVSEALIEFREQQTTQEPEAIDPEEIAEREAFKASLVNETEEIFSTSTHQDLLSRLGYSARA